MGSLVISEVAHDASRYPWSTMRSGNAHQSEAASSDSSYHTNTQIRSSATSSSNSQRQSHANSSSSTSHATQNRSTMRPPSGSPWPPSATSEPASQDFAIHQSRPSSRVESTERGTPPSPTLAPSHNEPHQEQHSAPSNTDSSSSELPSPSPSYSPGDNSPPKIKVRGLHQIQDLINEDFSNFGLSRPGSSLSHHELPAAGPQYEISGMPVTEIIEMVAGVLTKITTSNDVQHEHLHSHLPTSEGMSNQQTASVIAFHGKNKPNISILSYLSRIHKYCPTTYEVFVSLLVYFDRMTNRVNSGPMQSLHQANQRSMDQMSLHTDDTQPVDANTADYATPAENFTQDHRRSGDSPDDYNLSQLFVVDSFNIHRLVIAGVTCASKFFSDVFYTNSRYAKVGGLPQAELNHLELQFLLLNDFRLSIPVEELEAYGTMLVEFYAREVIGQQQQQQDNMEDIQAS